MSDSPSDPLPNDPPSSPGVPADARDGARPEEAAAAEEAAAPNRWGELLETRPAARVAEILVVFGLPLTLLLLVRPLAGDDPLRFQALVWGNNVLMMALIWWGLRLRGRGWAAIGLTRPWKDRGVGRTVIDSGVAFALGLLGFVVGSIVAANVVGVPGGAESGGYGYLAGNLPALLGALAAVYVVSSLGEEIVYRGFLIRRIAELRAEAPRWKTAVVFSAIVFGLIHFSWGPAGMIQTTFMGLGLGIAYLRQERRLGGVVLAHAYMDTILFVQLYLGG